jgi:hypothetical protein
METAMSFQTSWVLSFIGLLLLAVGIGWSITRNLAGILIDHRGRFSLNHFQVVLWTLVILSSLIGLWISKGFDAVALHIPAEVLGLMGIAAGSSVLAGAVKAGKEAPGAAVNARVARAGMFRLSTGGDVRITPRFSQIWLEEEGDYADKVVSITKYQSFIVTLIVVAFYLTTTWKQAGLPEFPENVLWLIGISHAGYVGGKIPNKS